MADKVKDAKGWYYEAGGRGMTFCGATTMGTKLQEAL